MGADQPRRGRARKQTPPVAGGQFGDRNTQINLFTERLESRGPVVSGNVPQVPPAFQPREDLLAKLRSAKSGVSVVSAMTGLRGVGKTQVAAAYARECINAGWQLVAWINAENITEALAGLALLDDQLGISQTSRNPEHIGKLVRARIEASDTPCLLVFDNVTDLEALIPYVPAAGKAQVVITSTTMFSLGTPVPVDVFTVGEALAFLSERTGSTDADGAALLAEELGCLALALAQAATVIARQALTYSEYLERLRSFPLASYLKPNKNDPYPRSLAEAVLLSLDDVAATDRTGVCADLMGLISMMSPAGVSRDLLRSAGLVGLLSRPVSPAEVDEALGELVGASLLSFSGDQSIIVSAHRLVMRVVRERHARAGTQEVVWTRAYDLVKAGVAKSGPFSSDRANYRDLVSHLNAVYSHLTPSLRDSLKDNKVHDFDFDMFIDGRHLIKGLIRGGLYSDAIPHCEFMINFCDRWQKNQFDFIKQWMRGDLGYIYLKLGRPHDAIPPLEQVLADAGRENISEYIRNNDIWEIPRVCALLTYAYQGAGRHSDVIKLLEPLLEGGKSPFGRTHPLRSPLRRALTVSRTAIAKRDG
jgi:hypothetical protein